MRKNNCSLVFLLLLLSISSSCHSANRLDTLPAIGSGLALFLGAGHLYQESNTQKAFAAMLTEQDQLLQTQIQATQGKIENAQAALKNQLEELTHKVDTLPSHQDGVKKK